MMTSYKANAIRKRLLEFTTLMAFSYQGVDCDIDPFNPKLFHISCGSEEKDVYSIEDVMNGPHFCGKALSEIADEIEIEEW